MLQRKIFLVLRNFSQKSGLEWSRNNQLCRSAA
jgi:hypothetical protein